MYLLFYSRQYDPGCGQRLEGVASGYWTVSAKHRVASSAIRVRVPRPPRSLDVPILLDKLDYGVILRIVSRTSSGKVSPD